MRCLKRSRICAKKQVVKQQAVTTFIVIIDSHQHVQPTNATPPSPPTPARLRAAVQEDVICTSNKSCAGGEQQASARQGPRSSR
eukprot:scaffold731_cov261-Pinguiococcus_pyrenoidosus.AAC.2